MSSLNDFPHPDLIQSGVKQATQGNRYQFYAGACYLLHARAAALQGASGLTVKFFTNEDPDADAGDELRAVLSVPDERKDAPDLYFPHGLYIEVDGVGGNSDVALVEADWVPRDAYCRAFPRVTKTLEKCWESSPGREGTALHSNFDEGDPDDGEWANEGAAGAGGVSGAPTVITSASDPTVNDDSGDGYSVGDLWVNTTDDGVFVLADATAGAAVWTEVGAGGGLTDPITLTATEDDVSALTFDVDAAGFADVEAITVNYDTGALGAADEEAVILVNIDETSATGGEVSALEVLATEGAADAIYGLFVGVGVGPLEQLAGTFADADAVSDNGTDQTTALSDGGAGNITCFENDNEYLLVEKADQFQEIEVDIGTAASGAGIAPTFEYSTGVGTWASFGPIDGTSGMTNTGVIAWTNADVTSWATGDGGNYVIRITRTRNTLATAPILDKVQVAATTEYGWDKDANVSVKKVSTVGGGAALETDLLLSEASDHTSTPADGKGILWVKSDTPCSLQFTDDLGTDINLTNPSGVVKMQFRFHQGSATFNTPQEELILYTDRAITVTKIVANTTRTGGTTTSTSSNYWKLEVWNGTSAGTSIGSWQSHDGVSTADDMSNNLDIKDFGSLSNTNVAASTKISLEVSSVGTPTSLNTEAFFVWVYYTIDQ